LRERKRSLDHFFPCILFFKSIFFFFFSFGQDQPSSPPGASGSGLRDRNDHTEEEEREGEELALLPMQLRGDVTPSLEPSGSDDSDSEPMRYRNTERSSLLGGEPVGGSGGGIGNGISSNSGGGGAGGGGGIQRENGGSDANATTELLSTDEGNNVLQDWEEVALQHPLTALAREDGAGRTQREYEEYLLRCQESSIPQQPQQPKRQFIVIQPDNSFAYGTLLNSAYIFTYLHIYIFTYLFNIFSCPLPTLHAPPYCPLHSCSSLTRVLLFHLSDRPSCCGCPARRTTARTR
jgi:hypothetical protein